MANPFSHFSDEELMVLYQKGEDQAFEVIYSRHKDKVYSYLGKRLHDKNMLDDLFQKVFTKFHKSRHLYDHKFNLLPWLYTITKSELLDFVKKPNRKFVELEEGHLVSDAEAYNDQSIDLNAEKSLSPKEREALSLRYDSDSEFEEIAKILNTSQSNARKLISRGLKKLRLKYSEGK